MAEAEYRCRYCGTELQKVRIGDYWAYICPSQECKAAHYPTGRKEERDGKD